MTPAPSPLPRLIRPMLTTGGPLPSPGTDEDWAYELQWDGVLL